MSQSLLGASEVEVARNLDMFIDLLLIVAEDRELDDPDNNPDSVVLYQKLFADDGN